MIYGRAAGLAARVLAETERNRHKPRLQSARTVIKTSQNTAAVTGEGQNPKLKLLMGGNRFPTNRLHDPSYYSPPRRTLSTERAEGLSSIERLSITGIDACPLLVCQSDQPVLLYGQL